MQTLDPVRIAGEPYDVGYSLGVLAKPAFNAYLAQSSAWHVISRWRGDVFVRALQDSAHMYFPDCMAELKGMAAGLDRSFEDIFLWNCRGELLHNTPEGCTTIAAVNNNHCFIAHNEDGDPYLRDKCFLVDVQATGKPGFISFYYPGSLPGHTFAVNRVGVVQTINNLRIVNPLLGVPRMMLCRAVLDAYSLDEATAIIQSTPRASGFHHMLGYTGGNRILSIEATAQHCSIVPVTNVSGHANHMIHGACADETQIITDSSRDRQRRIDQLLAPLSHVADGDTLINLLHDQAPSGLPIYRDDPHDPDGENTLATALFNIQHDRLSLSVYQQHKLTYTDWIISNNANRTAYGLLQENI